jgi:hypothetical protein
MKKAFQKLEGQFNKVMDRIDPPHQPYPQYGNPPPGQYNYMQPPGPYGSHPYQPNYGPPPIPNDSRPYMGASSSYGPPPIPERPYEAGQEPPPPAYGAHDQAQVLPYWAPPFTPDSPISLHWDYDLGGGGWGNNELQNYTSFPPNAFHSPHRTLIVHAIANSSLPAERDKYTSARLVSKQRLSRKKGYVSAVIAAPSALGVWPAFWMLPEEPFKWPEDGECDIFESWNAGEENHSCFHWGNYTPEQKKKHRVVNTRIQGITNPHEYGFAWDQPEFGVEGGRMMFYVDGKPIMKCEKPAGTKRFEGWRVLLNVAMGGNVCNGQVPRDGSYQMEVFALSMRDDPPGGWTGFERDWKNTSEGRTL